MSVSLLTGLLAAVPIVALLTPFLLILLLRIWGKFLQAGSSDRRYAIYAHAKDALKNSKDRDRRKQTQDNDDDWEKVESTASAPNGEVPKGDWEGIIGFFHPFW